MCTQLEQNDINMFSEFWGCRPNGINLTADPFKVGREGCPFWIFRMDYKDPHAPEAAQEPLISDRGQAHTAALASISLS